MLLDLRRDIKWPTNDATVSVLLKHMDDCKYDWWRYATRKGYGKSNFMGGSDIQDGRGNYSQFQSRQPSRLGIPNTGRVLSGLSLNHLFKVKTTIPMLT
jgi:hypothetical protein